MISYYFPPATSQNIHIACLCIYISLQTLCILPTTYIVTQLCIINKPGYSAQGSLIQIIGRVNEQLGSLFWSFSTLCFHLYFQRIRNGFSGDLLAFHVYEPLWLFGGQHLFIVLPFPNSFATPSTNALVSLFLACWHSTQPSMITSHFYIIKHWTFHESWYS